MLGTIISTSGSTPASALSRMIVTDDSTLGTVGGGCMEADVIEAARSLMRQDRAAILTFHLNEDEMIHGLICGGTLHVLVEPVTTASKHLYEELRTIQDRGEDCIVATHLTGTGKIQRKWLVKREDTANPGRMVPQHTWSAAIHRCLHRTETQRITVNDGELILEPVTGRPQLVIFGGGHVSRYISRTASMAGFRVTVVDDRAQYANPQRFPEADATLAIEYHDAFDRIPISGSTYIVIVTRGHRADEAILAWALETPATYIGMIGSVRKVLTTYERLVAGGISPENLKRVHAPMGLEIGAATAEEIGVSVVAELIQRRRNAASPVLNMRSALDHHVERLQRGQPLARREHQ